MNNNDERKIEFSHTDVLNAILHKHGHEQHYATQESVNNLKERLINFENQVDKRFESIDKRFDSIDKRFESMDGKFDAKFSSLKSTMIITAISTVIGLGSLMIALAQMIKA